MLAASLALLPALVALVCFLPIGRRAACALFVGTAWLHLAGVVVCWIWPQRAWATFDLDPLGKLFLTLASGLFALAALSSVDYLERESRHEPNAYRRYLPCLLFLLAAATLVSATEHLAALWAAVEATTLAAAPLVYFHKRRSALEAAWKFLLLCSVGIALALLGTFFLGIAASGMREVPALTVSDLSRVAGNLNPQWLRGAFVLALVGYGTKMGLAPLHTWLPDTHSQAPSPVSAFLSGTLINCGLLGILRFFQICAGTEQALFAQRLLLVLGFISLAVAAAYILTQRDFKRLFAYSSVENMGVIAVGVGLGGAGVYGALYHTVNHALAKTALFLLAGNLLAVYGSTRATDVRGAARRLPVTGLALAAGTLAIGGSPPFGPFMSELTIFQAALSSGRVWMAALFASLLAIAFLGLVGVVMPMVQGEGEGVGPERERLATVGPPLAMLAAALCLGLYVPPFLSELLHDAAKLLGAS